jgi:hypothetical protein
MSLTHCQRSSSSIFFLTTRKGFHNMATHRSDWKRFLTLVITKLSDLTRASPVCQRWKGHSSTCLSGQCAKRSEERTLKTPETKMKFEISLQSSSWLSLTHGRGTITSSSSHAICAYDHTVPTSGPMTSVHARLSLVRRVGDIT